MNIAARRVRVLVPRHAAEAQRPEAVKDVIGEPAVAITVENGDSV
jgi:hypothetical protein